MVEWIHTFVRTAQTHHSTYVRIPTLGTNSLNIVIFKKKLFIENLVFKIVFET